MLRETRLQRQARKRLLNPNRFHLKSFADRAAALPPRRSDAR